MCIFLVVNIVQKINSKGLGNRKKRIKIQYENGKTKKTLFYKIVNFLGFFMVQQTEAKNKSKSKILNQLGQCKTEITQRHILPRRSTEDIASVSESI